MRAFLIGTMAIAASSAMGVCAWGSIPTHSKGASRTMLEPTLPRAEPADLGVALAPSGDVLLSVKLGKVFRLDRDEARTLGEKLLWSAAGMDPRWWPS
jgi:hypothetical protein